MAGYLVTLALALGVGLFIYFVRLGRKASTRDSDGAINMQLARNRKAAIERQNIITDFGALMARSPALPTRIEDVSALPHPKDAILSALLLELTRGHDARMNEVLKVGAISLAQFQPGVGPEPLYMLGLPDSEVFAEGRDKEELMALAKRVTEHPARARFDEFNLKVAQDLKEIEAKLAAADKLRNLMPEEQKRRVLDGAA
jgi:hypothetical protein